MRQFTTQLNYPRTKTIHQLFEEQVQISSHKTAVKYLTEDLTYQELNQQSNQLARILRARGVTRNMIVGLMVERSLGMIVAILGILKAGGAYLPIDPQYPQERIDFVLKDSAVKFLITTRNLFSEQFNFDGEPVFLDDHSWDQGDYTNLDNINSSRDLIYVIYTSGSTGRPKGVMIEHQAVHNFIAGVTDIIDFQPSKTIVALTSISFDIFVLETLLPLTQGLTIAIADPRLVSREIGANRIDMLQTTPSTVQLILNEPQNLPCIKQLSEIMIGGEAFPPKLLAELGNLTSAKIYNMYGPTETTVWSMIKNLTNMNRITIGQPIANTQVYIVNEDLNIQPVGAPGELYIAGDGVARGYLNRPELSSERFIPDPFTAGQIMYKTGDLARELADGDLEFIRRVDHQVKIRGFRIELGEIEASLSVFPGIKECIVATKKTLSGEDYLVAYYISQSDLVVSEIISHLAKKLPEYMIPGFYIRLNHFPLTPNGKIDRRALPEPTHTRPNLKTEYRVPENEVEKNIATIWQRILNLDLVGINDNFFELGGNSVLLSMMYAETSKVYPDKLVIADIFAYPTVAKLTQFINQNDSTHDLKQNAITSIEIPKGLQATANLEEEASDFKFELQETVCKSITQIAAASGVKAEDLYLTVFMYLLSEITGYPEITVQTCLDFHNRILPVTLSFKDTTDFTILTPQINEQRKKASNEDTYPVSALAKINLKEHTIIPLFCNQLYCQEKSMGEYGIAFTYNETPKLTDFKVEFNYVKLSNAKIEELIKKYIKIINLIIE